MPKFPYVVIPGKDRDVYKPWISVNLDNPKSHRITPPIWALIDSGADNCLANITIGEWLKINFKSLPQKIFTAANGQRFKGYETEIVLFFAGKNYRCPFYFSSVIPIKAPIILGQTGFFDHHKVIFDLPNKELEVI